MGSRKSVAWSASLFSLVQQMLAPITGSGRGLFGIAALLSLFVLAGYIGWAKWGGRIAVQQQYTLTADSFEITPQPPWIHTDIRSNVLRDGSLANLSFLDPDLTKRVVQAFELNAWVAKAVSASKQLGDSSPRVVVSLQYREPVIMVRTRDPSWDGDCFWPVDTEGVFLPPEEFSRNQTRAFLRVEAGNPMPAGSVGTSYGDVGVSGAARIAAGIKDVWSTMGLEWILVRSEKPQGVGQPVEPTYLLLPAGAPVDAVASRRSSKLVSLTSPPVANDAPSLEVRWGHAPGREAAGEASAAEKVAALRDFVALNGRLDQLPSTVVIDLRPATGMVVTGQSAAQSSPAPIAQ